MKLRWVLLPVAFVFAAPAQAATYLISYTGSVLLYDREGVFGTAGTRNSDFTAIYTLTDDLPGLISTDSPNTRTLAGGFAAEPGRASPLSAVLTIGGVSKVFDGEFFGYVYQRNDDISDMVYHAVYLNGDESIYSFISGEDIVDTTDYTAPLEYIVGPSDMGGGTFTLNGASGVLTAQRLTISSIASVPEPAAWLTMIMGFGAIGFGMRRKQRRTVRYDFT